MSGWSLAAWRTPPAPFLRPLQGRVVFLPSPASRPKGPVPTLAAHRCRCLCREWQWGSCCRTSDWSWRWPRRLRPVGRWRGRARPAKSPHRPCYAAEHAAMHRGAGRAWRRGGVQRQRVMIGSRACSLGFAPGACKVHGHGASETGRRDEAQQQSAISRHEEVALALPVGGPRGRF